MCVCVCVCDLSTNSLWVTFLNEPVLISLQIFQWFQVFIVVKCNQPRPGFELVSPCSFPATITITPRTPPLEPHHHII